MAPPPLAGGHRTGKLMLAGNFKEIEEQEREERGSG